MVRYEAKTMVCSGKVTSHKAFVGCEDTLEEAKTYIASLEEAGVEIVSVEYYDRDERIAAIRSGNV